MKTLSKVIIVLAVSSLFIPSQSAEARKIRTKHSIPKKTENASETADGSEINVASLDTDSIDFCQRILPSIRFYGFDKTVGSSMESFFITNGLTEDICGIEVEISYTDMKGRQLHKRSAKIDSQIPTGETKRIDIKSWDTQKSFYFHKSAKPRRQATPFDVRIRLLSVTYKS